MDVSRISPDRSVASVVDICKQFQVSVHVRGTDDRAVIEFRDRITRRVVGGSEIKKRAKRYGVSTQWLLDETSE